MRRTITTSALAYALCAGGALVLAHTQESAAKIPITTSSAEARDLYLKGRDLAEKLRATDARRFYEQAVAKDKNFALGYVGLANTAPGTREFIDAVTRASALAGSVSEGERHLIGGLEDGLKGDPAGVLAHYTELVRLFPNDERARTLLGNTYFGRQEYDTAITHYVQAATTNPSFSQPYNQLGYAYRFLEKYDDAEKAFKKYTELIPADPNPYDSYAELLMKVGRFEESIKMYGKALSLDRNFIASHVGIGNNFLAMGKPEPARAAFAKIGSVARNNGERRQQRFWTAAAYVHEGATDRALAELQAMYALAETDGDGALMSGDLTQMGDVLREAGRTKEALAKYEEALTVIEKAKVPEQVKEAVRRNHLFEEGRVAATAKDIATAKAKLEAYTREVAPKQRPFEVRQQHELAGIVALAEKDSAAASREFQLANQQDPRIVYLTAIALKGAGEPQRAAEYAGKAAKFNGLNFNYAFVKNAARKLAGT